jgi:hypothetical protein
MQLESRVWLLEDASAEIELRVCDTGDCDFLLMMRLIGRGLHIYVRVTRTFADQLLMH